MPFDLAAIVKRQKNIRRGAITLRPISPTGVQASDLFRLAYAPFVETWAATLPRIEAEYARSLSALQTDSAADIGNILTEVDGLITRMLIQVRPLLSRYLGDFQLWHSGRWKGAILTATGVDMGTFIGPEATRETVSQALERNIGLIKSVSDDARKRIGEAVFSGLQERKPVADVVKDLRQAVDIPRARARRIASDQLTKLSSALDQERRREAGLDTIEWVASGKVHPRKWHRARNGKLFSEREARVGTELNGKMVEAMPPADDMPGIPIACGCRSKAVLTFD
jgi:SPP1 gp7 family putative phage head morphogenesis protein